MPLNASGPISLAGTTAGQSIQIENGGNGTTQISLNDAAVRSLAGVPSGAITMPTNFYGKANQFAFTISSNQTNANLRTLAVNAGWNGSSKVVATINAGVVLSANVTGNFGLTINGSFPNGVQLTNNGFILGMGGSGGIGDSIGSESGGNGANGGTGLLVQVPVTINNASGIIGGGGGGGGGGSASYFGCYVCFGAGGGGGGGGRTGSTNSSGGPGAPAYYSYSGGNAGGTGTFSAAGGGGGGTAFNTQQGMNFSGAGGGGGTWGASGGGGGGGSGPGNNSYGGQGSGGGGGAATNGAANITFTAVGTRFGTIG